MDAWVERELAEGEFPDERRKTRLGRLLGDLGQRIGDTVPMACQDWAATKAAYRFCSNPRVDDGALLAGHFAATASRFATTSGRVPGRRRRAPRGPPAPSHRRARPGPWGGPARLPRRGRERGAALPP